MTVRWSRAKSKWWIFFFQFFIVSLSLSPRCSFHSIRRYSSLTKKNRMNLILIWLVPSVSTVPPLHTELVAQRWKQQYDVRYSVG